MNTTHEFSDLFAAIDGKDARRFAERLTRDAVFVYGSQPPVRGRAAIEAAVRDFFSAFSGLEHRVAEVHAASSDLVVVEGEVTYHRQALPSVTVPFANVLRLDDGLIADYRIYIDPTPLAG
jgi:uncharacterized protein (TIGR02246 family)